MTIKLSGTLILRLKVLNSVKYLGVIFYEKMQWSKHIKKYNPKGEFETRQNKIHCTFFDMAHQKTAYKCTCHAVFPLLLPSLV